MKLQNILIELDVTDPILEKKIREYAKLSDEIDKKKAELEELTKKYKPLDSELRTILENIDAAQDRVLRAKDLLVTIKQAGYHRDTVSYKDAVEYLMGKVNSKIRALAETALDVTKKSTYVVSKLAVQKVSESVKDSGLISKISLYITKLYTNLTRKINSVDDELDYVEQMLS